MSGDLSSFFIRDPNLKRVIRRFRRPQVRAWETYAGHPARHHPHLGPAVTADLDSRWLRPSSRAPGHHRREGARK